MESSKVPSVTKSYLSERKSGERILFYAVKNIWDATEKKQKKSQIFLGSFGDGVYHFNEHAAQYPNFFIDTAHEMGYLLWRQQRLLNLKGEESPAGESRVKRAGITLLLDHVARDIPLWDTLVHVFGEEKSRALLSLAYYALAMSPMPLAKICVWSESRILPIGKPITVEMITKLFEEISEHSIKRFLSLWLETSPRENRLPFTITPKACIGKCVTDVMHGIRRDSTRLPELRLLIVMDEKTLQPLWFETLPWVESEKGTVAETLAAISRLDGTPECMVFDRSFFSEENFQALCKRGVKFTADLPIWKFEEIRKLLDEARKTKAFEKKSCATASFRRYDVWMHTKAVSYPRTISKRRMHVHLYYSRYYRERAKKILKSELLRVQQAVREQVPLSAEDRRFADRCLEQKMVNGSIECSVKSNITSRDLLDENDGYFAIMSSQFKDPFEAMLACDLRYTTETFFSDMENDEDSHRLNVYTPHNLYVRVFIQFIAQILRSHLRLCMNVREAEFTWGQPASAVLWSIDSLQQVELGGGKVVYKKLTPLQKKILDLFRISSSEKY